MVIQPYLQFHASKYRATPNIHVLEIAAEYDFLEECIIFGFHLRGQIFEVLNVCILIAKYYIHNKRYRTPDMPNEQHHTNI